MKIVTLTEQIRQDITKAVMELKYNDDLILPCNGFDIVLYRNKPNLAYPLGNGPIGCYINDTSGG